MDITKDNYNVYSIKPQIYADSGEVYDMQEYLGSGGNATVYEVIDCEGTAYAVKILLNLSARNISRFQQEIRVLREHNHPHLIKCIDEGTIEATKEGKKYTLPFMIMEKADYNLKDYLKKRGTVKFEEYISQFCGLSEALSVLNKRVVHRDIKLENILVIGERWVLSDLGLCSFLSKDEHEDLTRSGEKVGPKYWMSPESINKIYDTHIEIIPASDVFQLAAVFWFVVNGKYPLGIVTREDWVNKDVEICELLMQSLSHNFEVRPKNGEELYACFMNIRKVYEEKRV